jgi:hypothetical protein
MISMRPVLHLRDFSIAYNAHAAAGAAAAAA